MNLLPAFESLGKRWEFPPNFCRVARLTARPLKHRRQSANNLKLTAHPRSSPGALILRSEATKDLRLRLELPAAGKFGNKIFGLKRTSWARCLRNDFFKNHLHPFPPQPNPTPIIAVTALQDQSHFTEAAKLRSRNLPFNRARGKISRADTQFLGNAFIRRQTGSLGALQN